MQILGAQTLIKLYLTSLLLPTGI